jgi:hypothetical protein
MMMSRKSVVTPEKIMQIFKRHPSEGFSKRRVARIFDIQDRRRVISIIDVLLYAKKLVHDDTDGFYYLNVKKRK